MGVQLCCEGVVGKVAVAQLPMGAAPQRGGHTSQAGLANAAAGSLNKTHQRAVGSSFSCLIFSAQVLCGSRPSVPQPSGEPSQTSHNPPSPRAAAFPPSAPDGCAAGTSPSFLSRSRHVA